MRLPSSRLGVAKQLPYHDFDDIGVNGDFDDFDMITMILMMLKMMLMMITMMLMMILVVCFKKVHKQFTFAR